VWFTFTVKSPFAATPAASTTEQVTVVAPSGKVPPEPGVQVTAADPSIWSVAEAAKRTRAPLRELASRVRSDGSLSTGGTVSGTPEGGTVTSPAVVVAPAVVLVVVPPAVVVDAWLVAGSDFSLVVPRGRNRTPSRNVRATTAARLAITGHRPTIARHRSAIACPANVAPPGRPPERLVRAARGCGC
jgi:hypothetical protein